MRNVEAVVASLASHGVKFAAIGAAAMASRGFARATFDVDLLTTEPRVLDPTFWRELPPDIQTAIRRGDFDDPLRGVIRFSRENDRQVDLVVGKYKWQEELITRASDGVIDGVEMPLLSIADLVLMKLFAAGPRDLWDAQMMLVASQAADDVVRAVDERVGSLPEDAQAVWARLREEMRGS